MFHVERGYRTEKPRHAFHVERGAKPGRRIGLFHVKRQIGPRSSQLTQSDWLSVTGVFRILNQAIVENQASRIRLPHDLPSRKLFT